MGHSSINHQPIWPSLASLCCMLDRTMFITEVSWQCEAELWQFFSRMLWEPLCFQASRPHQTQHLFFSHHLSHNRAMFCSQVTTPWEAQLGLDLGGSAAWITCRARRGKLQLIDVVICSFNLQNFDANPASNNMSTSNSGEGTINRSHWDKSCHVHVHKWCRLSEQLRTKWSMKCVWSIHHTSPTSNSLTIFMASINCFFCLGGGGPKTTLITQHPSQGWRAQPPEMDALESMESRGPWSHHEESSLKAIWNNNASCLLLYIYIHI